MQAPTLLLAAGNARPEKRRKSEKQQQPAPPSAHEAPVSLIDDLSNQLKAYVCLPVSRLLYPVHACKSSPITLTHVSRRLITALEALQDAVHTVNPSQQQQLTSLHNQAAALIEQLAALGGGSMVATLLPLPTATALCPPPELQQAQLWATVLQLSANAHAAVAHAAALAAGDKVGNGGELDSSVQQQFRSWYLSRFADCLGEEVGGWAEGGEGVGPTAPADVLLEATADGIALFSSAAQHLAVGAASTSADISP